MLTFHIQVVGLRYVQKIVTFSNLKRVLVAILVYKRHMQPMNQFISFELLRKAQLAVNLLFTRLRRIYMPMPLCRCIAKAASRKLKALYTLPYGFFAHLYLGFMMPRNK